MLCSYYFDSTHVKKNCRESLSYRNRNTDNLQNKRKIYKIYVVNCYRNDLIGDRIFHSKNYSLMRRDDVTLYAFIRHVTVLKGFTPAIF